MRVFLDTNVIVAAFATRGLCADLFRYVVARHELLVGEVVLEEARRAFEKKLKLPTEFSAQIEDYLRDYEVVEKPSSVRRRGLRGRDDEWILESAISARADVLVTGDQDLLSVADQVELAIADPRTFWERSRRDL